MSWPEGLDFCESLAMPDHLGLCMGICAPSHHARRWHGFSFYAEWRLPPIFDRLQPESVGVRLVGFEEPTVDYLLRCRRSGYLSEAAVLVGLMVDVDSSQRRGPFPGPRPRGYRPYAPTIAAAHELACSVLEPTWALDSGGGVPCAYLFTEPVEIASYEPKRLAALARRFTRPFKYAADEAGYEFDSPQAATGWIRLPGGTTDYGDHTVAVLARDGPRLLDRGDRGVHRAVARVPIEHIRGT